MDSHVSYGAPRQEARRKTTCFALYRAVFSHALIPPQSRWFTPLLTQLTVVNLAHYTVLAMLAVHLSVTLQFSAAHIASVMLITSAALRFSRILLAPLVDRRSPRQVIPAAILLSLLGYAGLYYATQVTAVSLCMLAIGTGYGLNGMLVTTLASYVSQQDTKAQKNFSIYALMNLVSNLAGALAPVTANALRLDVSPTAPFAFAMAALGVSLLVCLRIAPDTPAAYREMRFRHAVVPLLRQTQFLGILGLIAVSWAVYTQKFAATPLFVNSVLARPEYVGLVITLNALIVLGLSLPAAHFVRRHHIPGWKVMMASFCLYGLAYLMMGLSPGLVTLWIALPLWSAAEAMLMPQLNALVAEYTDAENRLAGFSLSAVAVGVGEGIGNAAGAALMTISQQSGREMDGYLLFAGIALIACAAAGRLRHDKSTQLQEALP